MRSTVARPIRSAVAERAWPTAPVAAAPRVGAAGAAGSSPSGRTAAAAPACRSARDPGRSGPDRRAAVARAAAPSSAAGTRARGRPSVRCAPHPAAPIHCTGVPSGSTRALRTPITSGALRAPITSGALRAPITYGALRAPITFGALRAPCYVDPAPPRGWEPPSSSGLGRLPFKEVTRVRIPLGVQAKFVVPWCSLECTPACQAGGRGFKSRRDRHFARSPGGARHRQVGRCWHRKVPSTPVG